MAARPRKTPLDAALAQFANPDNRTDVLKVVHAILSTAMVEAALQPGDEKASVKKAAKAECYAEAIRLVEEQLGEGANSSFIPKKQTILTTPGGMPNGGVVRAHESRSTPQT